MDQTYKKQKTNTIPSSDGVISPEYDVISPEYDVISPEYDVISPGYDVIIPSPSSSYDLTSLFAFEQHSFSDLWNLLEKTDQISTPSPGNVAGVSSSPENDVIVPGNVMSEFCGPLFSGEGSSVMASLDCSGISAFYSGFYGGEISGFDLEEYDEMLGRFIGEVGYDQI